MLGQNLPAGFLSMSAAAVLMTWLGWDCSEKMQCCLYHHHALLFWLCVA